MIDCVLFPDLAIIMAREFNRENMIEDLLTISSNTFAFIIERKYNLSDNGIDKVKERMSELNLPLSDSEFNDHYINIVEELKKTEVLVDRYFENLFLNFRYMDILFYHNTDINIHKFKVIGNRIAPLIEALRIQDAKGKWTRKEDFEYLFNLIKYYLPDYEFPEVTNEQIQKLDGRLSQKQPTNKQRLKALSEFCPDFIKTLHKLSNDEKKDIIHLITGVNRDDSYKFIFTADKRILNETKMDFDQIDFEDLKTKLKNTETNK